jgi:hypothetical protein
MTFQELIDKYQDNPYGIGAQAVEFIEGKNGNSNILVFRHDDRSRLNNVEANLKSFGFEKKKMSRSTRDKAYKHRYELNLYESELNEANEEIKAQGVCKNTIFQVQKEVEKLYKDMQSKEYIDSFKTNVEVQNRGYQIKQSFDYKNLHRDKNIFPKEIVEAIYRVIGNGYLFLQPGTFFEDYFEEGKGANLEGKTFEIDPKQNYKVTYPKYPVTAKNDITKAGKDYLDTIKAQIVEIRKMLDL